MKKTFILLLVNLLFLSGFKAEAQLNVKDSASSITFFQPRISFMLPEGDMKERFYPNMAAGFGLSHKTAGNWMLGAEVNFLFGEKVRNEEQILANINTTEGFIIDQTGVFANIHFRQRGLQASVNLGKIFPTRFGNPNSGIIVQYGFGVLQHKIRIEVYENTAPQLQDDYVKGYDKLTAGPSGYLYLGYLHFSDKKLTNFNVGIEYLYARTQSLRDYDFILMGKDETIRNDQLISLKFSWLIPFYQRAPKAFYFD